MVSDETNDYSDVNNDGSIEGLSASFIDVEGIKPRVDGIQTRYYQEGNGDPLVLLHGGNWGGTASANTWSRVIEKLSDRFHVIAPDRLGCGMTNNPKKLDDYVYGAELEHIISFINTIGIEDFHLAGQSRGGGIAGRVAAEIPDRVKSLIIINSATLSPTAGDKAFFYNRILRDAPPDENSPSHYADHHKHLYSLHQYSPDHVTEEFAKAAGYMRGRPKAEKTAEVLEDEGRQEFWEATLKEHIQKTHQSLQKGELQMPTLVYWGRNDPSVDLISGISLYDLIANHNPRAEMRIVNKAGHHPYREYPNKFVDHIISWVKHWEQYGYDSGIPETTYSH